MSRRRKKSKKKGPTAKGKIFSRAYDKATRIPPGSGLNLLTTIEFLVLLEYIRTSAAKKRRLQGKVIPWEQNSD